VDLDGDLDLLVENVNEPLRLYINHEGDDRNWARFDVVGEGANRYAIGARLDARIGDHWQQRFVQAGANYKTQDELVQHVGLGSAATIDEVVVTWIGGSSRTLVNVPANQTWTVYPLDKCGDADGDGDRDFDDYLAFAACYTGSNPAEWLPGCEIMDYEGDADVDLADFDMFLAEYDELLVDCNNNGVPDLREILAGEAPDDDNDGSIDGCVPTLPGDVDADGTVGLSDLLIILSNWGPCADCPPACLGDADSDCSVGLSDLLAVLSDWGS